MKVLSSAGYYGTGSSAITDFFSEFSNVKSVGDTEFKFLQDCDGVAALEMNLVEHPHRHNSCHAIKRFIKASKFENGNLLSKRYKAFWGDDYWKYTMEYVDEITELRTTNMWRGDAIERGTLFYMLDALVSVLSKKLGDKYWTSLLSIFKEQAYFSSIERDAFYTATKRYTSKLFNKLGDGCDYLMIDQLTPPSEIDKYINYVENLKVVIIDRDPRDVYLEWVKYPHYKIIPQDAYDFCKWFKILRAHRKREKLSNSAILIHFEDLIYDYDATAKKLISFAELDELKHNNKLAFFNPEVSIKNTKKWLKTNVHLEDIKIIEKELEDYLYTK